MCGIFGYTGQPTDAAGMVFAGLKKLEYRGYDSWGIAVGAHGNVHTARDVGKLGAAPDGLPTSGLALVHNGVIENYVILREALLQRGHSFRSQTDTEVAAHMVEEELDTLGNHP